VNKIKDIDEIFTILKKELKNYKAPVVLGQKWEKIKKTPFTTLISCILSLRTKDEVTDKASIRLFEKYDTPQKLANADIKDIEELIYPVGFYHTKAKTIKEISQTLLDKYAGEVPDDFDELLKLKGVGRKTANIVMVFGFNKKNYIPVDVHCNRIPNRLGWIKTKTPEETEKKLKEILPQKYWYDFNNLFVQFGQTICTPISPFCSKCPINKYCKKQDVKTHR
jgi:endonuclease III